MNLKELLTAISYQYDIVKNYAEELRDKCQKIKENNELNGIDTYKINSISGKISYIDVSLKFGEILHLLNDYKKCFNMVEDAIVNGTSNIDLNNDIIQSASKNLMKDGKYNPVARCDSNVIDNVKNNSDYLVSPHINQFGKYMKTLCYYCLDDYVDYEEYSIDAEKIYEEIDEDDYTVEEMKEIREATKYIGVALARKKKSNFIKLDQYLIPTKLDENLNPKQDNIVSSSKKTIANQMIDAMVNGTLDIDGNPICDNSIDYRGKSMGYSGIQLLGLVASISSIIIATLGILFFAING